MKTFAIVLASSVLFCGASVAEETVIHNDGAGDRSVTHRSADVDHHVVEHEGGCATKTVKKTDGAGDSMSKTKSDC